MKKSSMKTAPARANHLASVRAKRLRLKESALAAFDALGNRRGLEAEARTKGKDAADEDGESGGGVPRLHGNARGNGAGSASRLRGA